MIIPWFLCSLIDVGAGLFGYATYVTAQGGPGWHRGRFGADRLHFIRMPQGTARPKRLKPANR